MVGTWLGPLHTAANLGWWVLLENHYYTKFHDPWTAKLVYDDVRLPGCQFDCNMGFGVIAYPTKISMNHTTGMEVIKTVGNAG